MPEHNFKIGQRLFFAKPGGLNKPDGAYVVVKRLPMRDGEFEYQIKSVQLRPYPWKPGRRTR